MRTLLLLLLIGCLGTPSLAQEDPFVRCTRCQNRGMRICKEHKKDDCELELNARYCTLFGECEACHGLGWSDCGDCENPPVEARLAKKLAERDSLREGLEHYSKDMGRPLGLAQSEHFVLLMEVEVAKVDKKKLRKHALLHLYLDRLEQLFRDYSRQLHLTDEEFSKTTTVLIWGRMDEHLQASTRYTGQQADGGVKLMGIRPVYSIASVPRLFPNDEQLHRNVMHNVTHLLLSSQSPIHWFGNRKGGWADEGLAHWFEDYYFQVCDNYCFQESDTSGEFKGGKWKPGLRKELAADSQRLLPALFEQNTDTLDLYQHALSFSLVDYLMTTDGELLNKLFVEMRKKLSTRDALKKVYGISVLALEDRWREWVQETYPSR